MFFFLNLNITTDLYIKKQPNKLLLLVQKIFCYHNDVKFKVDNMFFFIQICSYS